MSLGLPREILALLGFVVAPTALAQQAPEPGATTAAPVASGAEIAAELRAEYIAGERILVPLVARNPTAEAQLAPDIAARPWLVSFELRQEEGKVQRRRTTPPAQDPGTTLTIPPRSQRRTVLELPSGGALAPGSYTLTVTIDLPSGTQQLASQAVVIAPARPVEYDLGPTGEATTRQGVHALWLHQAASGYDLYLHHADGTNPRRTLGDYFLLHTDARFDPVLSVARPSDQAGRYVVWVSGQRELTWVRLQGHELRGAPRSAGLPWPRFELMGRPATDASGDLHVPFWVPAPRGTGGELRVLSAGGASPPGFRRIASYDARPDSVVTAVDAGGAVQFLVVARGTVDLFTIREQPGLPARELPLPGRRILAAAEGESIVAVSWGSIPETGEQPGGRAVMVLVGREGALEPRWLTAKGEPIRTLPALPRSPEQAVVDLLPDGNDPPGLLLRVSTGPVYTEGAARTTVPTAAGVNLVRTADGKVFLRQVGEGGPVVTVPLDPVAPPGGADGQSPQQ